jgi:hypothetical protein
MSMHPKTPHENWVRSVCLIGQGHDCCRYLLADAEGFHCAKHVRELAIQLDDRVALQTITARGDNCLGYGIDLILT